MRILVVENNNLLGDGMRLGLKQYHHTVDWVKNEFATLQALQTEHFDMVVLDLNSTNSPEEEILKKIRAKDINVPVIVIAKQSTVEDRVRILDAGADDFLAKPFDLEELCARIRAIKRRTNSRIESLITHGLITLDPATRTVHKKGKLINLPRREFVLLQLLMENPGRVMNREQIMQILYGWGADIDSNALEVHIHNLRAKFNRSLIKTVRGVGYALQKQEH